MSEDRKPNPHKWIMTGPLGLVVGTENGIMQLPPLTPDEAVALGYALFDHGLYLKGKVKP
jgi:hypothetical protein